MIIYQRKYCAGRCRETRLIGLTAKLLDDICRLRTRIEKVARGNICVRNLTWFLLRKQKKNSVRDWGGINDDETGVRNCYVILMT